RHRLDPETGQRVDPVRHLAQLRHAPALEVEPLCSLAVVRARVLPVLRGQLGRHELPQRVLIGRVVHLGNGVAGAERACGGRDRVPATAVRGVGEPGVVGGERDRRFVHARRPADLIHGRSLDAHARRWYERTARRERSRTLAIARFTRWSRRDTEHEHETRSAATLTRTRHPTAEPVMLSGIDYVELWVGNARQAASFFCSSFGFQVRAYAGPETGVPGLASYVLEQGSIRLVLTGA